MPFFISLGNLDKTYIIYPIISIVVYIILNTLSYTTTLFDNIGRHLFIAIISKAFGKSLTFFLYLFLKIKSKNLIKEEAKIENKLVYKKEYIDKIKKINTKKYTLLLITSILNFTYKIFYHDFAGLNIRKFSLWILDIIYVCIFGFFILKTEFYKHQYFSIIIIVILGVGINIVNLYGEKIIFINIIWIFLIETQYCLNIIINKLLMDELFCTAFEICFYEGFFSLILSIILLSVFTYIEINIGNINYNNKTYIDNFYAYFDNFNLKELFVFFFLSIMHFISYLYCLLTIKSYTIFHIFIILIFDEGKYFTHVLKEWKLYTMLILYFSIFFMILVFNEILVLNICGLEKNIKKNIRTRSTLDSVQNIEDLPEEDNLLGKEKEDEGDDTVEFGQYKVDFENMHSFYSDN